MARRKTTRGWSTYQRSDGSWVVQYKDGTKWREKRVPATAGVTTKRQADAWAREWTRTRGEEPEAPPDELVGPWLDAWVARRLRESKSAHAVIRETTARNNRGHVDNHVNPRLGHLGWSQLDAAALRAWVVELRDAVDEDGEPCHAPVTVRNIAATLRAALDDAVDAGKLVANPMRIKSVARQLPEDRARKVVLVPVADAALLLTDPRVSIERRVRYVLGLLTGLRDGELAALTVEDVIDLDGEIPRLRVNKQLLTTGKLAPPKTKHGVREVPLHPVAADVLRRWLDDMWCVWVGREPTKKDIVMPDGDGEHWRPKSAELIRADLRTVGRPDKYDGEPIEFHALRRTFATSLAEADVPERLIKRLMGHGASGVTDAHYTAKTLRQLADAVAKIPIVVSVDAVVALPDETSQTVPFTATFTAGVRYENSESGMISGRRGPDSNRRVTVLQTVA